MPVPKPRNAWSLVFLGGPLDGVTNRWNLVCPADWSHKDEAGEVSLYRIREVDEVRRVATMELVTDA